MNRPMVLGVVGILLGSTGCATSVHRDTLNPLRRTSAALERSATHKAYVSMPPEQQGDVFMASQPKTDKYRLSHYFPGLGKTTPVAATVPKAKANGAAASEGLIASRSVRSRWSNGALRGPQSYSTDVAQAGKRTEAEPSVLPVALQIPSSRVADRAVTTTSADVADEPKPAEPQSETNAIPSNPDSSSAPASPASPSEPQLAVGPIELVERPAKVEAQPEPVDSKEVNAPRPDASADPEPKQATEPPAEDPRERPRLSAIPTVSSASEATRTENRGARATSSAKPAPAASDVQAVKAVPTPADPANSLGLPPAALPASYTRHDSVAVRGSYQGSEQSVQPPPVLASPQVEASPQSMTASRPATAKTWQRPCLRRMVRRVWNLGEFANPPTAQPH